MKYNIPIVHENLSLYRIFNLRIAVCQTRCGVKEDENEKKKENCNGAKEKAEGSGNRGGSRE